LKRPDGKTLSDAEKEGETLTLNPSYFSPAYYKILDSVKPNTRWAELEESAYWLLSELLLEDEFKFIPDWLALNEKSDIMPSPIEGKNFNVGWDAFRMPWRVSLDFMWFNDRRAAALLKNLADILQEEYNNRGKIFAEYGLSGQPIKKYENPAFYAVYYYPLRLSGNPDTAEAIYLKAQQSFKYNAASDDAYYLDSRNYYVNSWAWMAEALKQQVLKNFFD
jgi:endoglucanase